MCWLINLFYMQNKLLFLLVSILSRLYVTYIDQESIKLFESYEMDKFVFLMLNHQSGICKVIEIQMCWLMKKEKGKIYLT